MRKIIVVGGGVIGLCCAFYLALEGYKVGVITRDFQESASKVAGGMLAPFSEGLEGDLFDFSYGSLKEYPEFVRLLSETSRHEVDFREGGFYRIVLKGEEHLLKLAENYREAGYGVDIVEPSQLDYLSPEVVSVLHYTEEAWVDTETLMDALLRAVKRLGVELLVDHIVRVSLKEGKVLGLSGIRSAYDADFYVFALGAWTKELFDLPVYPIKGQGLKLKGADLQRVHYSSVSYLIPRRDYLYVGATSEDVGFSGGNTLEGIRRLSEGAVRVVPSLSEAHVIGMLYGYRPATPDEKPIFEVGENYVVATGHYRNGILHAPLTAKTVVDYLRGKKSHFIDLFSPERFS